MSKYRVLDQPTPFQIIYDRFLGKITDDMYVEWTKEDTVKDQENILMDALVGFEFPRFPLFSFTDVESSEEAGTVYIEPAFTASLTNEEINILALLMYNAWLQRQIASIENTRQKYTGADFKMTSQANHLSKLMELKREAERQSTHMQRLYKRRKMDADGNVQSNWSSLMESRVLDG